MSSPLLVEALASIAVTAVSSGIVATLASKLKSLVSRRRHDVIVRLASGREVKLELDRRLTQEKASELVMSAVRSAEAGDEPAVRHAVEASRTASAAARGAAS